MVDNACTWCGQAPCACGVEPIVDLDIGLTPVDPFIDVPDAARRVDQAATRRVSAPFELIQATIQSRRIPVAEHTQPVVLADFPMDFDRDHDDRPADPFDATDNFSMEALFGSVGDALVLGDPTNIVESVKLTLRNVDIDLDLDDSDLADSDEGTAVGTVEKQLFIGADVERLLTPLVVLERRPTAGDLSILSPFERFVLEQIDGKRTMHDIQYAMSLSEGDLRIAVALLADKQLVQLAASTTATPASTELPASAVKREPVVVVPPPVIVPDVVPDVVPIARPPSSIPAPVSLDDQPAVSAPSMAQTTLVMLLARASRAEEDNDLDGAIVALRSAVDFEPLSAVAWNRLGVLLARMRDIVGAVAALDRALELRPDDPTIKSNHQKIASIAQRQLVDRKKPGQRRR